MSDLVRVREGDREFNVGRSHAEARGLTILDEPVRDRTGELRPVTRSNGRKVKPKVSVAEAAEKKAASTADKSEPSSKE